MHLKNFIADQNDLLKYCENLIFFFFKPIEMPSLLFEPTIELNLTTRKKLDSQATPTLSLIFNSSFFIFGGTFIWMKSENVLKTLIEFHRESGICL